MPLTAAVSLFDALKATPILRPAQLQELERAGLGGFSEARALAQHLLERGWLTPYQVNQLLLERGSELVLGPYILIERLGEGFGGQVFKARHQLMNRIVALRLIRKELLADQQAISQFYAQVEAASKLDHENVIHAYDAGPIGATHFLATEFVVGTDLGKLVRDSGPLPVDLACSYIYQAALGLQHGADHGLTHRGLTPSKLIVTQAAKTDPSEDKNESRATDRPGIVKITDLGLGRLLRTREAGSADAECYRAPEQRVDGPPVDIRADIFSLGCVFYYLLTAKPPAAGGSTRLEADLPADVSPILARMMAASAAERHHSPGEVAQALQPFARVAAADIGPQDQSHSETPRLPPRPEKSRSDAWRWLLYVGASAALLVAGVAVLHSFMKADTAARPTGGTGANAARITLTKLQARAKDPRANLAELWPEFVRFRMQNPGTQEAVEAGEWLARLTAPLDRLDPQRVSAEDRLASGSVPDLVLVLGQQRWHTWGPVRAVAYAPDGKQVVVAVEGQIMFCDPSTGARQSVLQGAQKIVTAVALAPDGARLVSGSHPGKSVRVWDVVAGKEIAYFSCSTEVEAVAISADKKSVAAAAKGGVVHVWGLPEKKEKAKLAGSKASVLALAFSPDGAALAVGGHDGSVRLWHVADKKDVTVLPGHAGPVHTVAFAADGALVASGGQDEHLRITEVASGKELHRIKQAGGPVLAVRFAADGQTLTSAGANGVVQVWEVASGKEQARHSNPEIAGATALSFSPDGQALVTSGASQVVRVWSLAASSPGLPASGHTRAVTSIAFSPDGQSLASASHDNSVRVWDLAAGKERLTLPAHASPIWAVAFAPDGQAIASAGDDRTVKLWDATTGSSLAAFGGFSAAVHALAFSADGQMLATGADDHTIKLWDLVTKTPRKLPKAMNHTKPVRGVAFAPDGRLLASAALDQTARLWDVSGATESFQLTGTAGDYTSLAFATDGQGVAVAGASKVIRIWDTTTGRELNRLAGLNTTVVSLAYSADGSMLASAEADGQIVLWQLGSNRRIRTWHLPGPVNAVAFAPDSRHLATANGNGSVYIFRVAPRQSMPR